MARRRATTPYPTFTPEQQAERARTAQIEQFVSATRRHTPVEQATARLSEIANAYPFPLASRRSNMGGLGYYLSLEVEQSWAVGASLTLMLDMDRTPMEHPETGAKFWRFEPTVTINWSSCSRSIAMASSSVALYAEMVKLGAHLENVAREMHIGHLLQPATQPAAEAVATTA
jgi:hypothetical protein